VVDSKVLSGKKLNDIASMLVPNAVLRAFSSGGAAASHGGGGANGKAADDAADGPLLGPIVDDGNDDDGSDGDADSDAPASRGGRGKGKAAPKSAVKKGSSLAAKRADSKAQEAKRQEEGPYAARLSARSPPLCAVLIVLPIAPFLCSYRRQRPSEGECSRARSDPSADRLELRLGLCLVFARL
jgi:hypothetical protein